uniref:Exopolygalacturonase-like n=1 Tax=Nelumbo nucifera TaxID=4432 RepID=A0A822YZJ4_NELNU|nr:TPA_asm: hypothetical protein HUJ06_008783 [Nelumbo nucifera]
MKIRTAAALRALFLLFFIALELCVANGGYLQMIRESGRGFRSGSGGAAKPRGIIFNVKLFGAKPDGRKDNTQAFMRTWVAACNSKDQARVLIPEGIYRIGPVIFQGPCNSPDPIIVQVKGTVKATDDISEYPSPEWVSFEKLDGVILTGGGTFDGQGQAVWQYNDCSSNAYCQLLPTSIKLSSVSNAIIRRIKSINSKSFHIGITNGKNIKVRSVDIVAPEDSPNTDGIHISRSFGVSISKAVIGTGDDCISIGQGSNNVTISKVTCGPGHGISVGSLGKYPDEQDVNGITVKNCTLVNTDNGLRIKTWPGSPPSQASNIVFQDIIMENVSRPIIINQQYCASTSSCTNKEPSNVKISNVFFQNIRGTSASDVAVKINCSSAVPCEGLQLFDINLVPIAPTTDSTTPSAVCSNAKISFGGVQVPEPCTSSR